MMMKTFLSLLFASFVCWAQCQTSQTIANSYTLENETNQLVLDLDNAKVEIRKTAASRISVEMTVQAELPNDKMLGFLIEQGRYAHETSFCDGKGTIKLANKKNKSVLLIKGKECKEEISYVIYVPNQIQFVKNANGDALLGKSTATALSLPPR